MKADLVEKFKIPYYVIQQLKLGHDMHIDEQSFLVSEFTDAPEPSYSYAYISDSIYDPGLVPLVENVDLLYHESTFLNTEAERAKLTHHSTAIQAAQIAKLAQVKKLLLGHISARYLHREMLFEEEARSIFPNTYLVEDGQTYSIY